MDWNQFEAFWRVFRANVYCHMDRFSKCSLCRQISPNWKNKSLINSSQQDLYFLCKRQYFNHPQDSAIVKIYHIDYTVWFLYSAYHLFWYFTYCVGLVHMRGFKVDSKYCMDHIIWSNDFSLFQSLSPIWALPPMSKGERFL